MNTSTVVSATGPRATPRQGPRLDSRPGSRLLRLLRSAGLWLGAVVGITTVVIVVVCLAFQLRPQVVVSGSMEPTLPVGSLLLVAPTPADGLRAGDIVTVERPRGRGLVTHRIVSTSVQDELATLELNGDANATVDPDPYVVRSAGRLVVTIPGAGYVAAAVKSPLIMTALLLLVFAVLLSGFVRPRRRHGR